MRQQFITPVGTDLVDISLPGIAQIRGIVVDNPSGAWLKLFPTYDDIPPYTVGWARTLPGGVVNIDIRYAAAGPASQPSTRQGDPLLVVLDSEPVGNSPGKDSGAAFITKRLARSRFSASVTVGVAGSTIALVGAVANQRIRLFEFRFGYDFATAGDHESPARAELRENVNAFWIGDISDATDRDSFEDNEGYDLATGSALNVSIQPVWARVIVAYSGTYAFV